MTIGVAMTPRVCHIISGDLWAGAEVMAFHLLRGLKAQSGTELFAIVLNEGKLSQQLENAGIQVFIMDETRLSFREIVWRTARIVRQKAPSILHAHRYKENLLAYLISIPLRGGAALVSTQHGMPEYNYGGAPAMLSRLKSQLNNRLMASRFDKTVAVSSDIRNTLVRDYGFRANRVDMIHNGIVVPKMNRHSDMKSGFVVGSAGRFVAVKDYPLMVNVAKEVVMKAGEIRFELAGEGPALGDIKALIDKYGLQGHFNLCGFLDDVSPYYQGLDVYVNTSLHEGIPMSVLEAMAYGVPVVVPKVGGLQEFVTDGVDGYLVDSRDPADFRDRILALYENETLRERMGHAARQNVIQGFSVERMVNAYRDMYSRLIENAGQ
jgi:glycosyltransferase involved in cell wall biosynthesis